MLQEITITLDPIANWMGADPIGPDRKMSYVTKPAPFRGCVERQRSGEYRSRPSVIPAPPSPGRRERGASF